MEFVNWERSRILEADPKSKQWTIRARGDLVHTKSRFDDGASGCRFTDRIRTLHLLLTSVPSQLRTALMRTRTQQRVRITR